jgi:ubiquinone/menaquinone biosynthesis C-methylase UbiE
MTINSSDEKDKNTYFFDPEGAEEMARLINLDHFVTRNMGGFFTGIADPSSLQTVLDLACGPGGWVLDVAFAYPKIQVVGVDISKSMIEYALARAGAQGLDNAYFEVMDITKPLEFTESSFDLVNARFLFSVLHREAWEPFIAECTRILRPGGILRLTDMIDPAITTSAACERRQQLSFEAQWRLGYGFSPTGRTIGVTSVLPSLLRKAQYQQIQLAAHALEFSAGTESWMEVFRDAQIVGLLLQPLLVNSGVTTQEEADHFYQQMLIEMQAADFCGMWHYMTIWGTKP